jgi:hypothetical protein
MLGDVIGILEHTLVRRRGTDGADHPFPDPCDDGLRTSPAQQPVNVGAVSSKETGTRETLGSFDFVLPGAEVNDRGRLWTGPDRKPSGHILPL